MISFNHTFTSNIRSLNVTGSVTKTVTMNSESSFGDWLRRRRRALDLTREELARQVGCSAATIRKIEADERRPSKQIAARLADCLAILPEEQAAFITFARTDPFTRPAVSPPSVADPLPWHKSNQRLVSLPAPLTRLIGREQAVAAARNYLLRDEARLLTLVGPPGIGKTRLSLNIAAELADAFDDGVVFISLAPITEPGLAVATIAQALEVEEQGSQPLLVRLKAYLRLRRMLLILDNFEQLLAAAPLVTELLESSPGLKLLVTSRAALQVRGEWQLPVGPLLLPDLAHLPPLAVLAGYPAIALFLERTEAVNPDFILTEANASAVATICAHLDGLPLAIELAAAWSKLLPPQELLARLSRRLTLLTEGPLDLPARHRTLRAAIGWSYDLLSTWEQRLLTRLAVFVGGCTLVAAEAICAEPEPTNPQIHLKSEVEAPSEEVQNFLDTLASLVNKSLLQRQEQADGQSRFTMLETIREYALEQLETNGRTEHLRQQHAAYYLALAETAEPELRGPQQQHWLEQLETEHNNLRAALNWAQERRQAELALRFGAALWRFWELHSHLREGRRWLETVLLMFNPPILTSDLPADDVARFNLVHRAKVLNGAANLAVVQGDYVAARNQAEASLTLAQALADQPGQANAFHTLGVVAKKQAEYDRAAAMHGACLELSQVLGDRVGTYISLYNLAEVASTQGNIEQAVHLHQESLALKRAQGDVWSIAWSLFSLGQLAREQGDLDRAWSLQQESLVLRWRLADKQGIADCLAELAGLTSLMGYPEQAACLFGAVERLLDAIGASLSPQMRSLYDRLLATTRTQLAESLFAAAWARGQTMPLDEVIASVQADFAEQPLARTE